MLLDARHPALRWIAAGLAAAAAVWIAYAGTKRAVAAHYGGSRSAEDWIKASEIEPRDAENWYRLGRYRQLDFDQTNLPLAISYYRHALQLNPYSPYYKLDLATSLEFTGDDAEAEKYYRAAQADYPVSAEVSWKFGNFLLRQQRWPEAYANIRRAIEANPDLASIAVSRVWRSNPDVQALLQALPDTAAAEWAALSYLTEEQEARAGMDVWNHLAAKKPDLKWKSVFALIDLLVHKEQYDDAGSVWRESLALEEGSPAAATGDSLIYDGGFEKDLSLGGFGWQLLDVPGVEFDFDPDMKHSGERSARLTFDGTQNLDYRGFFQEVLVAPATRYRFQGYLRTHEITTESGIQFEISDPRDPKSLDVHTLGEKDTQPWTLEEAEFATGPRTRLIRIQLSRTPSTRLDNKIGGTVWVDDVKLVRIEGKP